jgi:hypothetical protein
MTRFTAESAEKSDRQGVERRRPGRVAYQLPELIRLLRKAKVGSDAEVLPAHHGSEIAAEADDPLRAAKGVATGVLLSGGLWVVLGTAFWFFLS